jgi:biopolymer transport protein ExbD
MLRLAIIVLVILFALQPGFATNAKQAGAATLITVAKNGAITVGHQRIKLEDLLARLARMGVTSRSKLSVECDEGVPYKDISRVMETLASAGLLPQGTID